MLQRARTVEFIQFASRPKAVLGTLHFVRRFVDPSGGTNIQATTRIVPEPAKGRTTMGYGLVMVVGTTICVLTLTLAHMRDRHPDKPTQYYFSHAESVQRR